MKLLLASALAFNSSPLNTCLDLPTEVLVAGARTEDATGLGASTGRGMGTRAPFWPPRPPPDMPGKRLGLPSASQYLTKRWARALSAIKATVWKGLGSRVRREP